MRPRRARHLPGFFAAACLAAILLIATIARADENEYESGARPSSGVGYRVIDLPFVRDGRQESLTVAVWYPTAAPPAPYRYGGPTTGRVAVDAPPLAAGAPYPLLVFSHGYGGGGISSAFFTEALAARGWIVACPDHHDRHSAVRIRGGQSADVDGVALLRHAREIASSTPADRDKYLYRVEELQRTLNGLIDSPAFGGLIDSGRIAVGGHSFGGFTALGLGGPLPQFRDPRVKAILLFSTGAGGYLFTDEELAQIRVPTMLFMGEREEKQTRGGSTMPELSGKIFRDIAAPKYFLEVKGGTHFSFDNRFSNSMLARRMSGTAPQFDLIRRYSIAFLERHVAGREAEARPVLERQDPLLSRYLRQAP